MLAHLWRKGGNPHVALCGKRLIGVNAPDDVDTCIVCEDLARYQWATRRPQ